jgi:hypothetical protein
MRPLFSRKIVPLFAVVAMSMLTAVACGTSNTKAGPCVAGQQIACACAGGGSGVQVCTADGTYGICGCSSGEGGTVEGGPDATSDASSGDGPCKCGLADGGMGASTDAGDGGCSSAPTTDAGTPGSLNWASKFGVTGATHATGVAIDPITNDLLMTGYFVGSTNFGGGLLTGGDTGDGAFLVRLTSAGTYKSGSVFEGSDGIEPEPFGVVVDGSGNVIVGGDFAGTTNFAGGGVTATGNEDIFLAKYSSTGDYIWAEHFGVASDSCQFGQAMFDPAGNLYVTGDSGGGALDLGCGALPAGGSVFVAKFSPSGTCLWSNAPTVTDSTILSRTLALDSMGNVLLASGFYGTINFGAGPLTAPGAGMDAFIAEYNATGTLTWAKNFGSGASLAAVTGIAADACGNILADGSFSGTVDFGCGTLTESGDTGNGDIFLAKLDPSGICVWSNSYGDPNAQLGGPLVLDNAGGPAITSVFNGTVDFGGGTLDGAALGDESTYIAKFDSLGHNEWAYAGGPPASTATNSAGLAIAANVTAVVATGTFTGGTLSVAGDALSCMGAGDSYLASFTP